MILKIEKVNKEFLNSFDLLKLITISIKIYH
jgi:hypothetical protein